MKKMKKMNKIEPTEIYVKAFRIKHHSKYLNKAFQKLAGHEKRKTPMLDMALKKLAGHEKYRRSSLDRAYAYLAGTRKKMKA
ncbi:MAG: hypothetical protein QXN16_00695 [Candidatus Micrarchaeaceae archaeon]